MCFGKFDKFIHVWFNGINTTLHLASWGFHNFGLVNRLLGPILLQIFDMLNVQPLHHACLKDCSRTQRSHWVGG